MLPRTERCTICRTESIEEWVPPVIVRGRMLAGTGKWISPLNDGLCPKCEVRPRQASHRQGAIEYDRSRLQKLFGGEKPVREFTFENFQITGANSKAFSFAQTFNPSLDNLYLWGPCGVGKTHLGYSAVRRSVEAGHSVEIHFPPALMRKVRLKEPEEEQSVIDRLARAQVLFLDDVGVGTDSPYSRQILQEILDKRVFADRAGLIVTSRYALESLANRMNDDTIPSRLAGMCTVIGTRGIDRRLEKHPRHETVDYEANN